MKRSRSTALAMSVFALATTYAACARATGEVHGGEQIEETTPAPFVGCDLTETIEAGSGSKWTDLYRDLFGPDGAAKCATPACHGSNDGAGFKTAGFACMGEKECRQGVLDFGLVRLPSDTESPGDSALIGIIRHCDDQRATLGTMPKQPVGYYFSRASVARIEDWIRAGAPDN